jgi:chromosome segregation ATPase
MEDLNLQIASLQKDLVKSEEYVIDYEVRLMKSEADRLSLIEQVNTLDKQIREIETTKSIEITSLEENNFCLKMKLDIFLNEISCLKDTLLNKESELEEFRKSIELLEDELEESLIDREREQAENRDLIEVCCSLYIYCTDCNKQNTIFLLFIILLYYIILIIRY